MDPKCTHPHTTKVALCGPPAFTLPFTVTSGLAGHTFEYRMYWYGYSYVKEKVLDRASNTTWSQAFSYDNWGNLAKSGSVSFQHSYSSTTNQATDFAYDAAGNTTSDGFHTYTWNAYGQLSKVDLKTLTYNALGQLVQTQVQFDEPVEYVYGVDGAKLAAMRGQTVLRGYIGPSVYLGSTLDHWRHTDWLGSTRLTSKNGTYSSQAYAPFGEIYAVSGSPDNSFTGKDQDVVYGALNSLYDFPAREYNQYGRWISPDPAGLAAADPTNPQSWNRYAYALNDPTDLVDPLGLTPHCSNGHGGVTPATDKETCKQNGGEWIYEEGDVQTVQNDSGEQAPVQTPSTTVTVNGDTNQVTTISFYLSGKKKRLLNPANNGLDPNSTLGWTWNLTKSFFSVQPQIDAWNKGYYKCLAQKNLPGFSAVATIHVAGDVATETASHFAPQIAGAYYHFTDARFTAWGKYSKVLVPEAAGSIKLWAGRLNAAGWAYADYELAKSIGECSEVLQ